MSVRSHLERKLYESLRFPHGLCEVNWLPRLELSLSRYSNSTDCVRWNYIRHSVDKNYGNCDKSIALKLITAGDGTPLSGGVP